MTYPLFLIEPTDDFQTAYRRWTWVLGELPNSMTGAHDCTVVIGTHTQPGAELEGSGRGPTAEEKLDPRWPTEREGYTYTDADEWQIRTSRLWTSDGLDRFTYDRAPVGACHDMPLHWYWPDDLRSSIYKAVASQRRMCWIRVPDGKGGHWFSPDRPASNGPGWTVTGTLPVVSVSPSVHHIPNDPDGWHGWIGVQGTPPGFMSRDLDGRPR